MCYASKGDFYRNMLFRVLSPRRCECDHVCLNVQGCAFDNTLVQSELLVLMKATVQPVFNMLPPPLMVLWFHTQFGSRFITAKINREGHPNTRWLWEPAGFWECWQRCCCVEELLPLKLWGERGPSLAPRGYTYNYIFNWNSSHSSIPALVESLGSCSQHCVSCLSTIPSL